MLWLLLTAAQLPRTLAGSCLGRPTDGSTWAATIAVTDEAEEQAGIFAVHRIAAHLIDQQHRADAALLAGSKQAAAERRGMRALGKHLPRFEIPFWPDDIDGHKCRERAAGRRLHLVSLAGARAPVLMEGDGARQVEALLTHRAGDPLARGSQAFCTVASCPVDRAALVWPEARRALRFARQACSMDPSAMVRGASLSGQASAEPQRGILSKTLAGVQGLTIPCRHLSPFRLGSTRAYAR
jgi:hypothetical protein